MDELYRQQLAASQRHFYYYILIKIKHAQHINMQFFYDHAFLTQPASQVSRKKNSSKKLRIQLVFYKHYKILHAMHYLLSILTHYLFA